MNTAHTVTEPDNDSTPIARLAEQLDALFLIAKLAGSLDGLARCRGPLGAEQLALVQQAAQEGHAFIDKAVAAAGGAYPGAPSAGTVSS